jgi:predicted ATPase
MLSTPQRVRLHRQIGEALEHLFGINLEPHLAELAYHFFQAAPGGEVDKALTYAVQAGERATVLLAYEEAIGHYERALQVLELQGADEGQRCELLLALGDAQRWTNDIAAARVTFQRAASWRVSLGCGWEHGRRRLFSVVPRWALPGCG